MGKIEYFADLAELESEACSHAVYKRLARHDSKGRPVMVCRCGWQSEPCQGASILGARVNTGQTMLEWNSVKIAEIARELQAKAGDRFRCIYCQRDHVSVSGTGSDVVCCGGVGHCYNVEDF